MGWGRVILLPANPPSSLFFCALAGLDEGVSSTILVIIIVALGAGMMVITIALYLNYRSCKKERRKLPYRQKEKNKEEESQFAVQQSGKHNKHNC